MLSLKQRALNKQAAACAATERDMEAQLAAIRADFRTLKSFVPGTPEHTRRGETRHALRMLEQKSRAWGRFCSALLREMK